MFRKGGSKFFDKLLEKYIKKIKIQILAQPFKKG